MIEFKLPAIGEGVVEGEIVRWLKQPGDSVKANEPLVEVMTDKATVEIPSPLAGKIAKHVAQEGAIAEVGEVIALFGDAVVAPDAPIVDVPPKREPAPAVDVPPPSRTPTPPPVSSGNGRVLATPAARALARETGVDLSSVSNDRGRITKADVLSHRAQDHAPSRPTVHVTRPPESFDAIEEPRQSEMDTHVNTKRPVHRVGGEPQADEEIPFRGMRRRIAEGLKKSYSTAVHYTYVEQVDVSRLVDVRNQAKGAAAQEGVQLTYLPFIVKAVIRGLKRYPIVNAVLDEEGGRIVLKKRYSIGVATATDQGLLVPVVHDADRLSLLDIASEIQRLSDATRAGRATREELTGSTFTITSLGAIGGVLATPILNYPEVGILGVHAIRKTPIVTDDDRITIGHLMNLSVALDHRVVDGFEGANFLQEVKRYLEDPTLLLLSGI
jgi:pyruvate dehydrogenase E2 component (dihydrolipoamide acetyltransferase)